MRVFYTTADACCEIKPTNFSKEEMQHEWVETNLQLLFPNLELVKRKLQIATKIPDTIAYDHIANTFVAIEYKNRRSDTVREQAEDYLNKMDDNRDTLVVTYNERQNVTRKRRDSFNWSKMYVVIIAPEFTERQISTANRKDTECLYELKRFENGLVILRFVGGKHDPIDTTKKPEKMVPDPKIPEDSSGVDISIYETKNPFYVAFRNKILSTFQGMYEVPTKTYVGFKREGELSFCTAEVLRSKIAVCYGKDGGFKEDGFVKNVSKIGHYGMGDYRTYVINEADLEKILPILKQWDKQRKKRR